MRTWSAVLLSELDRIGAAHTEELVRSLLPDPDGPATAAPVMSANAVNYAICYVQRSGSTHLTSLLQNTGVAGKPADFFNVGYRDMRLEREQVFTRTGAHTIASAATKYGCRSVADYLNVISREARGVNGVFGMKMDLCHASILIRRGMFWNPEWKYIYVTRQDLLMQAVSYYIAQETGLWSSMSAGPDTVGFNQQAIEESILYLAGLMSHWEMTFALFGIHPLRITYEEIESAPEETLARCLGHIGVSFAPAQLAPKSCYRLQRASRSAEWAERIRANLRGGQAGVATVGHAYR